MMLGDGKIQTACDNAECNFDGGDTGWCASGCTEAMTKNTDCDSKCITEECGFDMPACEQVVPGLLCFTVMVGNHECDPECNIEEANWDGGDCNCAPLCTNEMLYNDDCDDDCAIAACLWDNHKCVIDM